MSTPDAARIDLGRACTNACLFCAQAGAPDVTLDVRAQIASLDEDTERVFFAGGEPSLRAELETLFQAARARGVKRIGLQSNGAGLTSERIASLQGAGLTDLELTLQAPEALAHDYLTATVGSFARVVDALAAARDAGLQLRTASALMRSNFRHAPALAEFVAGYGVNAHIFVVARVAGRAQAAMPRLIPRLAMALPWALRAAVAGERRARRVAIAGAPLCLLGPHVHMAAASPVRSHPEPCASCVQRDSCPGVDAAYVARFGSAEISPQRARNTAKRSPQAEAVEFAGIGPEVIT